MCHFYVMKKRTALPVVILLLSALIGSAALTCVAIRTFATAGVPDDEGIALPVLMYHSVLKDPGAAGKFVVSPDTLESDLKYLQENGYRAVFVAELVDYVQNGTPLPEKPVMLTFDDGYLNNLTYVVPLLERYDMKATISVVGSFTERSSVEQNHSPSYSNLSWEDIRQSVASGRVEIGNHTYDMHSTSKGRRGCMKKKSESTQQYQALLAQDLKKTQELLYEHCGIIPVVFTYPFGSVSDASEEVVRELGFSASLGCYEQVNYITRDTACLYQMCRFNRPSGISTEKFMQKILP